MRRIIVGGIAAAMGVAVGLAPFASAGGNGAWHLWLQSTTTSDSHQCDQATTNANQGLGFANVNAPGQPGSAKFVNGEISLKNADPAAGPYTIYIADNGDNTSCKPEGMIEPNSQGNGNSHIADMNGLKNGSYYVVLQNASDMSEAFASGDLTVN